MGNACAGRVALVTGAGRGIGRAIAVRLTAEGADVAMVSRPKPGMPQFGSTAETVAQIESLGRRAHGIEADLADPEVAVGGIVAETEAALGPIDILVNNVAGVGFRPFLDWTDEQIGQLLQVPDELTEPLDTMAESALALCSGDSDELTGVIGFSLQALVDLDRPVHNITGTRLVDGWQPGALPEKIAIMTAHRTGETVVGEVRLRSATLDSRQDATRSS